MKLTYRSCLYLAAGLLSLGSSTLAQSTTLGVVYLNSNTPNPDAAWISRGLADMLTTDLSKISKLTVVQREQLDKILKEQALGASGVVDPGKAAQLGKLLGVQTLLTGSYAAIGRNVRVDLQLINTATGRVEGGVTAEGSIDSIFSLEKQLVLAVINKLGVTPSPAEMQAILQPETLNNQAIVLNYQALTQLQSNPKAAVANLQRAVALDPRYVSAQVNLTTALEVSGESLVSNVLDAIDVSQREKAVALEAARMVLSYTQPVGFKFVNTPKSSDSANDNFTVEFENTWAFKNGLIQNLDKLLSPFSNQRQNEKFILLKAPNFGRNGEKKIYLSKEAINIFTGYLDNYAKSLAFMSVGEMPIAIGGSEVLGLRLFKSDRHNPVIDQEFLWNGNNSMVLPLGLIKNIKSISSIPLAQGYLHGIAKENIGADSLTSDPTPLRMLEILPVDANELNFPAGVVIVSDGYSSSKDRGDCSLYNNSSDKLTKEEMSNGRCVIYTKINDAEFSIGRLKEYLYRGDLFTVRYYSISDGTEMTTENLGLILSVPITYSIDGFKVEEIVNVKRATHYQFYPGEGNIIKISHRFSQN